MGRITVGRVLDSATDSVAIVVDGIGTGQSEGLPWTGAVTGIDIWDGTGVVIAVTMLVISVTAACTVTVFDETDSADNWLFKGDLPQYGGVVIPYGALNPRRASASGNDIKLTTSASGGYVMLYGWVE